MNTNALYTVNNPEGNGGIIVKPSERFAEQTLHSCSFVQKRKGQYIHQRIRLKKCLR